MQSESRQAHWENVYTSKRENEVSWFQESPAPSLALIEAIGAAPSAAIIDIGGGASRLADELIGRGFHDITVLDLSAAALDAAKARLGERAAPRALAGGRRHHMGSRRGRMISGTTGRRFIF